MALEEHRPWHIYTENTPEGLERERWEATAAARGRYTYQPYPAMLYKAGRPTGDNVKIVGALLVKDESEQRIAEGRGYVAGGQLAAIEAFHANDRVVAELAANRAYHERNMSDKAKAEARAVDEQTSSHLAEIPVTPIRKRGRPVKVQASEVTA